MSRFRFSVLILLGMAVSAAQADNDAFTRIALGSCAFQWEDQSILNRVVEARPDIYLSLGDAIYADFDGQRLVPVTPQVLQAEWDRLAALPAFKNLRENVPLMATWDNHDYGCHDCGAEFTLKTESEQIFLDFWQVPADAQVRKHPGVYQSRFLDSSGRRIQIILLDTRTFRDRQLLAERPEGASGSLGKYAPNPDPNAKMLGAAQWVWLEEQLGMDADLRFIASSTQVIADQKGMDEWGNYPHERQRLLDLIEKAGAEKIILLSGNVHFSEVSRTNVGESQVYDFTVSGLTHVNEDYPQVSNPYRVVGPVVELNFGLVEIKWNAEDKPEITLVVRDSDGQIKFSYPVSGRFSVDPGAS